MDVTVTIKVTPKEYDLLRSAVRSHQGALLDERKADTLSTKEKSAIDSHLAAVRELDKKLR